MTLDQLQYRLSMCREVDRRMHLYKLNESTEVTLVRTGLSLCTYHPLECCWLVQGTEDASELEMTDYGQMAVHEQQVNSEMFFLFGLFLETVYCNEIL